MTFHRQEALALAGLTWALFSGCGEAPIETDDRVSSHWHHDEVSAPDCEAQRTSWISLQLNLDEREPWMYGEFNAADPANDSNFSLWVVVRDRRGRVLNSTLYARHVAHGVWDYHWRVYDGSERYHVAGSGQFLFSDDGSLQRWTEWQPLRLPLLTGGGWVDVPVDYGLSTESGGDGLAGVTGHSAPSEVTVLRQDGRRQTYGRACLDVTQLSERLPQPDAVQPVEPAAVPTLEACAFAPTRVQLFSGNLDEAAPVLSEGFDAARPQETSNYWTKAWMVDDWGAVARLVVYFRHEAAGLWQYTVLPEEGEAKVLGRGQLRFDDEGVLQRVEALETLYFPHTDRAVVLDFAGGGRYGVPDPVAVSAAPEAFSVVFERQDGDPGNYWRCVQFPEVEFFPMLL